MTPFIGTSAFANEIRNLVKVVSENDASVLLKGEKGTGKRLFAQSVHYAGCGSLEGFFEINCRLFRTCNASDINAVFDEIKNLKSGKKTLFVNSIEFMNMEQQKKLLEFLKDCSQNQIALKVICSTESDPGDSDFSQELFYQINNVVLNFMPLRQRREDILPICQYYFDKFRKLSGNPLERISLNALELLNEYYWKGNIDELINCFQRAFIIGEAPVLKAEDLGISFGSSVKSGEDNFDDVISDNKASLKDAVDRFKKYYVTKVLSENNWNQTKSARILGIQRTYVIRLINELQIRK